MTYSEEEINHYTNILKNLNDGLDIYTPILDDIPLKTPEKVSCKICGNTHFFKDHGFRYCNKCFILLVVFLSKIILPEIGVIFKEKVFTRDHIITKISWMRRFHGNLLRHHLRFNSGLFLSGFREER